MKEYENNALFWQKIDALYLSGDYKIIYRKGQAHPRYPGMYFPCDYGHIVTVSSDEETSMKVYKSIGGKRVDAIVICANLLSKDITINALVGLSEDEEEAVLSFLNHTDYQKCIYVRRGNVIPAWASAE